ncbi:MAG: carboxypeptidase-like regulatory domain-containing protein, partial [Gammaproteobacteria bacterium]|nr:carboxypeptidase-like regulatory domain-containing protein [Gammaproteobacteria bacterium]
EQIFGNSMRLRYGAFKLASELAWMDKPIANDEIGAYVRTDMHTDSLNLAVGYDYIRSGVSSSLLASSDVHNAYFNGNFRLTRNLSLGTSATVGSRSIDSGGEDGDFTWLLNNYVYYRSPFGTSRIEYFFGEIDRGLDAELRRTLGMLVSHDWRMPQSMRLSTEIRVEEEETALFTSLEREANVNFRLNLSDQLSWGMNASYFSNTGDQVESYDGISANADFLWQFMPNWSASLILSHNSARFDPATNLPPPTPMVDNETTGKTFWLTVAYGKASGQPIRAIGGGEGIGTARIQGEVFYDENGDFIRQPGEAPVVGAVVLLDGRYEARTDSLGRYLFEPVRAGSHFVALAVSELPLPWGLRDETPQAVNVGLRRYGEVNFAVVRLDETIAQNY